MPEADRDPEHLAAGVVELDALPLAEGRRAAAQVDDDVEHAAPRHPDELALAGCVWKWIPRSVPWREREWLSWTKSVGIP